uniref:Uncharacterized protein n=1 Tax=Musa acuminata subsp. malaccensis TaxID=214687 RepID=A0A804I281_MUSAM
MYHISLGRTRVKPIIKTVVQGVYVTVLVLVSQGSI